MQSLFIAAVLLLAAALSSQAATIAAASCSQANVATALSTAARNDTVTVPAGSCTWGTPQGISKGVTLTGAGVGNTIITSSGGSAFIVASPDATSIANSDNIKITGFTFDGANASCTFMGITGASGISDTKPYRYFIIGNNKFQNGCSGANSNGIIDTGGNANGQIRGVIYNNVFDRCDIILRLFSNNDTRESGNAIFNNPSYGVEDTLYFEGNTIQYSSSFAGQNPGWSEFGQGTRAVVRYNTYSQTNATTPAEIWDIHGFQNWNGSINSGQTGTMMVEFYGNTLTNMGNYRWIDHRATQGLFVDNIASGTGGQSVELYGMSAGASCASDINPTPSNYIPIINNTYFINNTVNGTVIPGANVPGDSTFPAHCSVVENTNWWNYNAACTSSACAVGIGRGTTAPTGSCTTGVGYWVSPTPTPTAASAVIQASTLYKCTSTNTWTAYYTPYTYPHPLTGASSATITPSAFPGGTVTQVYSQTLTATNFTGTVTWTRTAGSLPPGLSDCTGTGTTKVLSGTLTTAGAYSWTCHGTDGTHTADDAITMTVNVVPSITSASPLPAVTQGGAYNQAITISGGTTPITCALTAGTLSGSGLTLGSNCSITGTAATPATYALTIRPTDVNGINGSPVGFSLTVNAATGITAASCSQANVQTAITSSPRNGTVNVPAGSFATCGTWTGITLSKGIVLTGAGIGSTNIQSSNTIFTIAPDATALLNEEQIVISGFTMDGANAVNVFINIEGANGITDTKPYRSIVIHHNKFQNHNPVMFSTEVGAVIQSYADQNGQIRGVIHHNTFDRCNIILRLFSNDDTREWSNTAFNQVQYGTADSLFFEDNTILYSSSYTGDNPGWVSTGQGGRVVMRYNTWDLTNATTPQEVWDVHGFQNWTGSVNSGQTATMSAEYYGNTLSNMGTYRWMDYRGTQGLMFDNISTGSGGNSVDIYGMSTPASCASDVNPAPANYNPVINNSYFWNNSLNGTNVLAIPLASGQPIHCSVTENSNWWNYNAACTSAACTAGLGRGTTAPTGTCTTGTGYWVSPTPTPTASSAVIQASTLYKCTSTNTWTAYYTPYVYPHPLSSGFVAPPTHLTVRVVTQ